MGYDSYICTDLIIEVNDNINDNININIEKEGSYDFLYYDSDNETYNDALNNYYKKYKADNPPKIIYNKKWNILNKNKISYYEDFLNKNKITNYNKITIVKYKIGYL